MLLAALVYLIALGAAQNTDEDVDMSLIQHENWNLLPHSECGLRSLPDIGPRVIGGRTAEIGEFPWMVKYYEDNIVEEPVCGGAIISEKYILTAAHCCKTQNPGIMPSFGAGTNSRRMSREEQRVTAEEIIIHPLYMNYGDSTENDLCLIRLRQPLIFTGVIQPICLPIYEWVKQMVINGTQLELAGWGNLYPGKNVSPSRLQKTRLKVVHRLRCANAIAHDNLCAIAQTTAANHGDSGGPLMFKDDGGRYFIVGVVSYGPPSEKRIWEYWNSAYPKVYNYIIWILDNMKP